MKSRTGEADVEQLGVVVLDVRVDVDVIVYLCGTDVGWPSQAALGDYQRPADLGPVPVDMTGRAWIAEFGYSLATKCAAGGVYGADPTRQLLDFEEKRKAGARIRTADLLITNQLLYRLSYASVISWVVVRES